MQAVKLIISGSFWDSQIYSGFLTLFTNEGEIVVLNWDKAIHALSERHENLEIAFKVAFLESNLLYDLKVRTLLLHKGIQEIVKTQLDLLAKKTFAFDSIYDPSFDTKKQANPFPFPHADSEIYYNRLYVGLKSGFFSSKRQTNSKSSLEQRIEKHWDAPVLDIAGSVAYTSMALATGSEGLFEVAINPKDNLPHKNWKPKSLAHRHCTDCDWAYYSIYGSSHLEPAFMATFEKTRKDNQSTRKDTRIFREVVTSESLFQQRGYSWGGHDKIYLYHDGVIEVNAYSPQNKNEHFKPLGKIQLKSTDDDVISASVAPFGTVIESDSALMIVPSSGDSFIIEGEPVGWRVFSRTKHYTNQLHIIYEDRIEIWSFIHDYFVEQHSKLAGVIVD